jgi:hypothetical protein
MPEARSLKTKLLHELKEMLVVSLYLAFFFCAVATYRLLLPEPPAPALEVYGFALVKALVLAKVILLGRMMRVTRVFDNRPLIVPTFYKVALFGAFAFAFEALEHLAGGLIHGRHANEVFRDAIDGRAAEIMARTLVVLAAFVPFFAFTEVSRVVGEGRLREIFLCRRDPAETATGAQSR